MSHPSNKRERFLIADRKGRKRIEGYWCARKFESKEERLEFLEKQSLRLRDTTKLCSCLMCGNPRRYYNDITFQERKQNEKDSG